MRPGLWREFHRAFAERESEWMPQRDDVLYAPLAKIACDVANAHDDGPGVLEAKLADAVNMADALGSALTAVLVDRNVDAGMDAITRFEHWKKGRL